MRKLQSMITVVILNCDALLVILLPQLMIKSGSVGLHVAQPSYNMRDAYLSNNLQPQIRHDELSRAHATN